MTCWAFEVLGIIAPRAIIVVRIIFFIGFIFFIVCVFFFVGRCPMLVYCALSGLFCFFRWRGRPSVPGVHRALPYVGVLRPFRACLLGRSPLIISVGLRPVL